MSNSPWKYLTGTHPILLVAGHNFPHWRHGTLKPRDVGTGNLVEWLCQVTNTQGIIATEIQPDPNWYPGSDFRQEVLRLIQDNAIHTIIDIHGRKLESNNLIEVLPNQKYTSLFPETLGAFAVKHFKQDRQLTLCEELDTLDIPAIEVEVRRDGREQGIDQEHYVKAHKALKQFIDDVTVKGRRL